MRTEKRGETSDLVDQKLKMEKAEEQLGFELEHRLGVWEHCLLLDLWRMWG